MGVISIDFFVVLAKDLASVLNSRVSTRQELTVVATCTCSPIITALLSRPGSLGLALVGVIDSVVFLDKALCSHNSTYTSIPYSLH